MLEAYCWPMSVAAGEPVTLHGSADTRPVAVTVMRDGAELLDVWADPVVAVGSHTTPEDASTNGCGWDGATEIPTGGLASGYYAVTLRAGDERADAFFVVRPDLSNPAPIVLVLSTTTYNAYNDWGGPSLYTGGTRVSFERPMAPGLLVKPEPHRAQDAGRARP